MRSYDDRLNDDIAAQHKKELDNLVFLDDYRPNKEGHRWIALVSYRGQPNVWRCADWPECLEMKFGRGGSEPA